MKDLKCQNREVRIYCEDSCGLLAIGDMHVAFQRCESGIVMQGDQKRKRLRSGERLSGLLEQSSVLAKPGNS